MSVFVVCHNGAYWVRNFDDCVEGADYAASMTLAHYTKGVHYYRG